jgi:hypothetical protein
VARAFPVAMAVSASTGSFDISMGSDDMPATFTATLFREPLTVPIALRPPLMDVPSTPPPRHSLKSPVRQPLRARDADHGPVQSSPHGMNRVGYLQSRGNSPASKNSSEANSQAPRSWRQQKQSALIDGGDSPMGVPGSSHSQALSVQSLASGRSLRAASAQLNSPNGSFQLQEQVLRTPGSCTPASDVRFAFSGQGMFKGPNSERNLTAFREMLSSGGSSTALTSAYNTVTGLRQQMSNIEAERIQGVMSNSAANARLQVMRWSNHEHASQARDFEQKFIQAEQHAQRYCNMVGMMDEFGRTEIMRRDGNIQFLEQLLEENNVIMSEQE